MNFFIKTRNTIRQAKSDFVSDLHWIKQGRVLRKLILDYYKTNNYSNTSLEERRVIDYLTTNKISFLPYEFTKKYKSKDVNVFYDLENGLHYVIFINKRLYYRRDWSVRKIKKYHANLLAEQDPDSPHKYLSGNFAFKDNSVALDIGAAEGIFSLMVVEKARKLYLIEPDSLWVEALEATFKEWKNKITILKKFASSLNDEDNIALDEFFDGKKIDFIKIDSEGSEKEILIGAEKVLKQNNQLKIVIAAYHWQNEDIELEELLNNDNFKLSFSNGYVCYYFENKFKQPYLRRCLLRVEKKERI